MDLERLRCLRTGDLLKLYRHRWGAVLPDDDSGRADLFEILCVTSLALKAPKQKMAHLIETLAPWMSLTDAEAEIDHIQSLPIFERTRTARHLGDNMRLLNSEREALRLWTILPVDMTDEQLAEQRKAKSRARRAVKRRRRGVRTREQYLAELKTKPKPWFTAGVSRAQWYRQQRETGSVPSPKDVRRGSDATILCKAVTHPVSPQAEAPKRGQHERDEVMLRVVTKVGEGENQGQGCSPGLGPHLVSRNTHEMVAALQNWGKNAEKKNSTISRNKSHCGWNDLSEFEAFLTEVPWCPLEGLPRNLPAEGRRAAA